MADLKFPLTTDHLKLQPLNEAELWKGQWSIIPIHGGTDPIGHFEFVGDRNKGELGISVELDENYRNQGYGEEVFYAIAQFVFRIRSINEINAVCDQDNHRCIHALEKAGYIRRDHKDHQYYYSKKKDKSAWTGLYLAIGMIAGMILGLAISNLWIGFGIGILAGFVIGRFLDARENSDN